MPLESSRVGVVERTGDKKHEKRITCYELASSFNNEDDDDEDDKQFLLRSILSCFGGSG